MTYTALIYDRKATIARDGLLEVRSTSRTFGQQTSDSPTPRSTALRFSGAAGLTIPVGDYSIFDPGVALAFGVNLPISSTGIYLTLGYAQAGFRYTTQVEQAEVTTVYGGFLFSLNPLKNPVIAYLHLSIGIETMEWENLVLAAGIGMDFKVSKLASLFVEVIPSFTTSPFDIGWVPLRGGIRISTVK